ncbi:MAG: DNA polymerase III subunit alpha, partial [Pseudomonadota bacterium]
YALVSYQTAWLKTNHPVEFMAAPLKHAMHRTDNLNRFAQECMQEKQGQKPWIKIQPPCVNRSEAKFTVRDGEILYALGALKNVGTEAMNMIVEARAEGPFKTLFDFARRVDLKAVGKRPMEMLARAGGFDALEPNRRRVFDSIDALVDYSAAIHEERRSNQVSLFGGDDDALPPPRLARTEDWLPTERLREEHNAIGFYLSGHPLDDYEGALRRKQIQSYQSFMSRGGQGRIAGTLAAIQYRKSARGTRFAFIGFSDTTGAYEVMAFSDVLAQAEERLTPGANLVLNVEADEEGGRLMLRGVQAAEDVVADAGAMGLKIYIDGPEALQSIKARLQAPAAKRLKGQGPVHLVFDTPEHESEVEVVLPGRWMLGPEMKGAIKAAPGVAHVEEF